ncbi:MAG: hypothetical protein H6727_03770 [Myxococcales bacterium]|nr:hypothetical protein [Myxococcales bacterium]
MDRREFFVKTGALLATSFVGASMEGCQHTGGLVSGFDAKAYLSRLEQVDKKMMTMPMELFPRSESGRKREAFVRQSLSSLLLAGSLHDLPEAGRRHPAILERVTQAGPVLGDSLFKAATLTESVSLEQRKEIQRFLQRDEKQLVKMRASMLEQGLQAGVPKSRLVHMKQLWEHVQWRLQKQNPSLLFDSHVSKLDRIAAKEGISLEERRKMGQLTLQPYSACQGAVLFNSDGRVQSGSENAYQKDHPPISKADVGEKKRGSVGFVLMGIGGALTVGGVIASAVGGGAGVIYGGIFGWTPGAILLLIGIPLAIVGI